MTVTTIELRAPAESYTYLWSLIEQHRPLAEIIAAMPPAPELAYSITEEQEAGYITITEYTDEP